MVSSASQELPSQIQKLMKPTLRPNLHANLQCFFQCACKTNLEFVCQIYSYFLVFSYFERKVLFCNVFFEFQEKHKENKQGQKKARRREEKRANLHRETKEKWFSAGWLNYLDGAINLPIALANESPSRTKNAPLPR